MKSADIAYICEGSVLGASFRPGNLSRPTAKGILAIDPGIYLGWAFKCGGYIAAGWRDFSASEFLYNDTFKFLKMLIDDFDPGKILLEKYFIGGGAHDSRTIEQRGAIKTAVEFEGREWTETHPSHVRKHLGITGKANDIAIRSAVSEYFGTPLSYTPDTRSKRKRFFRPDVFDAQALIMAYEIGGGADA